MTYIFGVFDYVLVFIGILISFYLYMTKDFGYWKKRGIPEVPPKFLVGSIGYNFKRNQGKQEQEWYNKYGKIFGIYEGSNPALVVADPELVKDILVKDFPVFPDQRELRFGDPILDKGLFMQSGERWKALRTMMSPSFTSGKLRMMSKLMEECCQILIDNLKEAAMENREIDITQYASTFTMDAIARCAFGIKIDSRKDPSNPFVTAGRESVSPVPWRFIVANLFPKLAKLIRLSFFNPETTLFFKNVIEEVVSKRKDLKQEEKPKDFLQFLLEAVENNEDKTQKFELDDVVSQCVTFFIAGYFATSVVISFAAHQLAISQDIQDKLIKEIDETAKESGDLDYDAIVGMTYLEAFFQEVLRKYTPAIRLERTAVEDYTLRNTGITIKKGTVVIIPVYSLNHDANYFPDPDKFDPERFLSKKSSIIPFTNLPFGYGPRSCIGMRFSVMEIKMGLVRMLQIIRFKLGKNETAIPDFDEARGLNRAKSTFLKIELRK
ncbi:cytochrome P450 3A5-like isoform X1 [Centruroides sculpturatus]|uniref:cytochrome P450 3A5-like isoform X1 n=2 Tax=Centruroides sculpturatus TaxID=218467 RepID=UPI000C6E868A|nr:cytochrome P450 3A5-like isoform X1 [Centruroides sculpturatus]